MREEILERVKMSQVELQELHCMVRSKEAFRRYLNLTVKEANYLYEDSFVLVPTDLVRQLSMLALVDELASLGSVKALAKRYGVSGAFIKSVLKENGFFPETYTRLGWEEKLPEDLTRLGSVTLFCQVNHVKESLVRVWFKENNLNINEHINIEKTGRNEAAKGRKAELVYKNLRGDQIIEDTNVVAGSQSDYDFKVKIDGEVKTINVKSSKSFKTKGTFNNPCRTFWKISTGSLEKCDIVAIVLFDSKFDKPLYIGESTALEVVETGRKTITIYEDQLSDRGFQLIT